MLASSPTPCCWEARWKKCPTPNSPRLQKRRRYSPASLPRTKNGSSVSSGQGACRGFMGDGINDAPPCEQRDVGIFRSTRHRHCKESADLILLEKDLMVLGEAFSKAVRFCKHR